MTAVDTPTRGRTAPPRAENVAVVDEVRTKFSEAAAAILTEYRGLTVAELETLRRSLRQAGGEYKVYKNTLVRFATRDLGIDGVESLLEGPTAIAFADADVPGVARALRDFSRTNPLLVVKGGVMGGHTITSADAAALADIPPRDILLARFAGLLQAPLAQLAGLLQALPRDFAYGLKALLDKQGGAPEEAAPPADEASAPADAPVAEPEAAAAPAAEAPAADAPADAPAAEAPAVAEAADAPAAEPEAAAEPVADAPAAEAPAADEAPAVAEAADAPVAEAATEDHPTDTAESTPDDNPTEGAE